MDTSMTDPARIRAAINTIIDPCSRAAGAPAGLADMGLIRTLEVTASDTGLHVRAVIGVTEYGCLLGPAFAAGVTHVIQALPGISRVSVELDDAFDWIPEDMSPRYQDELARRREVGRKVFLPLIRADRAHQGVIGSAPGRRIVSISCLDKNVVVPKSLSNLSTMTPAAGSVALTLQMGDPPCSLVAPTLSNGRPAMIARRVVLAGAVVLCLAAVGCSSSSKAASTTSSGATSATTPAQATKLTVGTSPTISNASLYLATEDGTFAKNNLDVTPVVIQSGAQAIPQLLNGQIQFAAADPLSSILTTSKNVPLEIVVGGNVVPPDQSKDPSGLIVKGSSSIQSLAGLDGKTVAVNALNSLAQVGLEAAIDAKGGNSKSVKFVEVGFPQMVAAVQSGTVDAAATNEPFITAAKAAGDREIPFGGLATSMAGVPQVVYLTSKSYASSHPDVVKAFAASINAADTTLGQNPGLIRTVGAKSTTINAAALAKITLPYFGPKLSLDSLTKLETLMVKYGVLSAPVQNLGQSTYGGS